MAALKINIFGGFYWVLSRKNLTSKGWYFEFSLYVSSNFLLGRWTNSGGDYKVKDYFLNFFIVLFVFNVPKDYLFILSWIWVYNKKTENLRLVGQQIWVKKSKNRFGVGEILPIKILSILSLEDSVSENLWFRVRN